ncbi:MAG: PHP domain-containing protein [Mongoliitalea sp.]
MELHDENSFKIRSYQSAVNTIDRGDASIEGKSIAELQSIQGIGKSIAEVIVALQEKGTHAVLEDLLQRTPEGILEILEIKGLGPKKVKILWDELNITSTHELMEACQSGQVAKAKGFGEKTQESIIQALEFKAANQGKWLYADIEETAENVLQELKEKLGITKACFVGAYARKMEIIDVIEVLIGTNEAKEALKKLETLENLAKDQKSSSPFKWRGKVIEPEVQLIIHFAPENRFVSEKMLRTATKAHLLYPLAENQTLAEIIQGNPEVESEQVIYTKVNLPLIPEELRDGLFEFELAQQGQLDKLLTLSDLKGILHNHSTYSDGKHSLRQMAEHCKAMGYEYLGISDHSRTASYAGGLDIDRVQQQHQEINALNKELAPFKIFKGIESDILLDGSLDYPTEVLASFDFIVSSIHSSLNMDKKKATARLLKAIENPYTTILGHPTGRLLLRREGYPIDHKVIIDACAAHGVVIEINSHPWRLDLDWRWIQYAMEQGVMLSINPDAHEMDGYLDMKYGVLVGRKGGLTKEKTFNTLTLQEMERYLQTRKQHITP